MNVRKTGMAAALALCSAALSAVDIETALQQTAEQFSSSMERGTPIAIIGISSSSEEMSDFMLDDLTMRFVHTRRLFVANRANLAAIKTEMNFQLSGNVADQSIQQLGEMVGAKVVVHGKLTQIGSVYNLTAQALNVETATVVDMCRIRVEPNATTNYLLSLQTKKMKGAGSARKSAPTPKALPQSKYSGDIQLHFGYRLAICHGNIGNGLFIGATNYNLFNITSLLSVGFMESLSGSMIGNWGCNFVVAPAVGINVKDTVKFQMATGIEIGFDIGHDYSSDLPVGFALNMTAKFLPRKLFSPAVSFQYDLKPGSPDDAEYANVHGFNFTAGASFNFSEMSKNRRAPATQSKYSGDIQLRIGLRAVGCGDEGGYEFLMGGRNFNLFNISDLFSVGFFEDLSGGFGSNTGFNFVIGPAVGINIKDAVKFQLAPGLSIGIEGGNRHFVNAPVGFAFNATAKFLPSKAFSPFVSLQYDVKEGCYERDYYYQGYHQHEYAYAPLHAFDIAAGASFNFGRRH